jgi:SOS response regulatory protein OraA/RecX
VRAAHARGLRLLGVRSRGREELRRDLERRGFSSAAAGGALDRLETEGWLQDLAAACALARSKGARYGRLRIARELAARGFSKETAERALEAEAGREEEALAGVFRRLWKSSAGLPPLRRRRRVRAALLRRGFASQAISEIIGGSNEIDGSSGEIP